MVYLLKKAFFPQNVKHYFFITKYQILKASSEMLLNSYWVGYVCIRALAKAPSTSYLEHNCECKCLLPQIPCHPLPCTSASERSRSISDKTLKLSMTSSHLVSLEGPHCGGGNLSCLQCNQQLPRILIGIMYHWLSESICGPYQSQLIHIGQT